MNELFHAVSERLKVIFTAHAGLELESELVLLHAERKAALLKRASLLQEEGFTDLADELRKHAGGMDLCQQDDKHALAGPSNASTEGQPNDAEPTPNSRKKR
jgi:hypothetical protein